ncbi:unnamed protein product [Nesidiocoris tenuis]|uniref:Uncharacterized protein n=1 Tax=Nesidiocoris tenuis TaxID=355587 RepID=A0A6H5HD34_9HEMI|nr:unnamed protein product [Nesidiocoris tenuis]
MSDFYYSCSKLKMSIRQVPKRSTEQSKVPFANRYCDPDRIAVRIPTSCARMTAE